MTAALGPFSTWWGTSRVEFGRGLAGQAAKLVDETAIGSRLALVTTPSNAREGQASVLRAALGERIAAEFAEATSHTPLELVERARAALGSVDGIVTLGGGGAVGLGKALAADWGVPLAAFPTTYSGSEMTPLYGIAQGGEKRVRRDPRALPRLVVYDPDLATSLPDSVAHGSAMNCLGHCLELALLARPSPLAVAAAREACELLGRYATGELDGPARDALMAAGWLGGVALAAGGLGPHHAICHVIGGQTLASHAEIHGLVLSHSARLVRHPDDARTLTDPLAAGLGVDGTSPPAVLDSLRRGWDLPGRLSEIWPGELDLDAASDAVMGRPGVGRGALPLTRETVRSLLSELS